MIAATLITAIGFGLFFGGLICTLIAIAERYCKDINQPNNDEYYD